MRRFYAGALCPRGSADAVTCVTDDKATRGDGILVIVDPSGCLTEESRDELAHMIAGCMLAFLPTYEEN